MEFMHGKAGCRPNSDVPAPSMTALTLLRCQQVRAAKLSSPQQVTLY
jgi:hypothetical protein